MPCVTGGMAADAFVLDASVALAWFLRDHPATQQHYADAVLNLLRETCGYCIVPFVWHAEVAAVLLRDHRARKPGCTLEWLHGAGYVIKGLNIRTFHQAAGMPEILNLGLAYHLQCYDALYFDLAKVNCLPIATFDRGIITACKRFGVDRLAV